MLFFCSDSPSETLYFLLWSQMSLTLSVYYVLNVTDQKTHYVSQ